MRVDKYPTGRRYAPWLRGAGGHRAINREVRRLNLREKNSRTTGYEARLLQLESGVLEHLGWEDHAGASLLSLRAGGAGRDGKLLKGIYYTRARGGCLGGSVVEHLPSAQVMILGSWD